MTAFSAAIDGRETRFRAISAAIEAEEWRCELQAERNFARTVRCIQTLRDNEALADAAAFAEAANTPLPDEYLSDFAPYFAQSYVSA